MNMKMMMMAMIGLMYVHTYVRTLIYTQYLTFKAAMLILGTKFGGMGAHAHIVMLPVSRDKILAKFET